jgi:hypothetical protein
MALRGGPDAAKMLGAPKILEGEQGAGAAMRRQEPLFTLVG